MKIKKFLLAIVLVLIMALNVNADTEESKSDWSLKNNHYKTVAADPESIVQSGYGMQLSLHRKNLFIYLSKDVNQVRFAGQGSPDIKFYSAGIGMQHTLGKHLTLSVDVGWYKPMFKEMGEPQAYYSSPFAEGLCRYLNKFLMPTDQQPIGFYPDWEYYSLEYKRGIGGKLSLDFEYPITKSISFNMNAGYRYLKVQEHVTGSDYDAGYARLGYMGYWTVRYDRDFSAFMIGGSLTYKF